MTRYRLAPRTRRMVIGTRALLFALAATGFCSAIQAAVAQTGTGTIHLDIRDSETGRGIAPTALLIDSSPAADLSTSSRMDLHLLPGQHALLIQAKGYRDLRTRQTVEAGQNLQNTILLDPETPPPALSAAIARLANDPAPHLSGYVTDDATGAALVGAEISIAGTSASTLTDAQGFYSLSVPASVPSISNGAAPPFRKLDLTVASSAYHLKVLQHVLVEEGTHHIMNVRLTPGAGTDYEDLQLQRGQAQATAADGQPGVNSADAATAAKDPGSSTPQPFALQAAPTSIRVGHNCSTSTTCTTVETMTMETYVKHVLPAEWFSSWVSDSLKAGAVAIRSYGGYYVYHPLKAASYDICDTTSCQVYGTATATSTNNATDATAGIYVVDSSGNIGRAEYSAEDNNSGTCGDCNTINNPSDSVCLSDQPCCGSTLNGHGRGMCQWGTQRWASGTWFSGSGHPVQTYDWIVDHYYAAYAWTRQNLAAPSITQQPTSQSVCPNGTTTFTVVATGSGTLTYRWQKTNVNLTDGGHISGALTATLTVSAAAASDVAAYHCVVTANGVSVTSNDANLTLKAATSITLQPFSKIVCPGTATSFLVAATGDGTLTYQWQKGISNLTNTGHYSGVTTATLAISPADSTDAANYHCIVTGGCGAASSNTVTLSLNPLVAADFDADCDVDDVDAQAFIDCFTGPTQLITPGCEAKDLNQDGDIDQTDFSRLQRCLSGTNVAPDPNCGN